MALGWQGVESRVDTVATSLQANRVQGNARGKSMRKIRLTNCSESALIDDCDDYLKSFTWYRNNGYAARMSPRVPGQRRPIIYLHRVVAGIQDVWTGKCRVNQRVRIIGHNRLDNRRVNLG